MSERKKIAAAVSPALASIVSEIRRHSVMGDLFADDLPIIVVDLILADRASQLDSKRQEFLDRAAIAITAANPELGGEYYTAEACAYHAAERLWDERESRRNAPKDPK